MVNKYSKINRKSRKSRKLTKQIGGIGDVTRSFGSFGSFFSKKKNTSLTSPTPTPTPTPTTLNTSTIPTPTKSTIQQTQQTLTIQDTPTTSNTDIDIFENISTLAKQLVNPETKPSNAVTLFESYITRVKNNPNKQQQYDIRVLTSIMSIIHDYNKPVIYVNDKNKNVDANRDISCCDKKDTNKIQFYMEDFYCDDLNKFSEEYDNFIKTKQSYFFYKSNIANIALLFKCYYKRCLDKYIKIDFKNKSFLNSIFNHIKQQDLNNIFKAFQNQKKELIDSLIKAYETCIYNDVCDLYLSYLNFYNSNIAKLFKMHDDINIFDEHFLKNYKHEKNLTEERVHEIIYSEIISKIEKSKEENSKFYLYLSCSIAVEYKQARVYMTRFLNSYIGHGYIHEGDLKNNLVNTFNILSHDFYFHHHLIRLENTDNTYDNTHKQFIFGLYNYREKDEKTNNNIYKFGMSLMQYTMNEDLMYNSITIQYNNKLNKIYTFIEICLEWAQLIKPTELYNDYYIYCIAYTKIEDIWTEHIKYIGDDTLDMNDQETIKYKDLLKILNEDTQLAWDSRPKILKEIKILSKYENKIELIKLFFDFVKKFEIANKTK